MSLRLVPAFFALIAALAVSGCAGGMMGGGRHAGMGMGAGMEGGRGGRMMMAMSMGPMVGCPGHGKDADAQISRLHTSLNITAAQELAWSAYANAYRNRAGGMNMEAMQHQMGPAPARLGHRLEMMEQHLASMRTLRDTLDALYAVLTPEQKATADALVCEPHPHRGH